MHFKDIIIENFRGIRKIKIDDFRRVNLFVGRNNCGKTSILEAIYSLTLGATPVGIISTNIWRGNEYKYGDDKDFAFAVHNFNHKNQISIKALCSDKTRELIISPYFGENPDVEALMKRDKHNWTLSMLINQITGLTAKYKIDEKFYENSIFLENKKFIVSNNPKPKNEFTSQYLNFDNLYKNIPTWIDLLIVDKQIPKVIEQLSKIDNTITNISLGADNSILFDIGLNRLVPGTAMGEGIIKILGTITAIVNSKNGFLFIDEIENGLHHKSLEVLWTAIFKASKEYNVQIFSTTHSYECIQAFQKVFASVKHLQDEDEIRLYRIAKEDNEHIAYKFTNETIETMLNTNWEVR